MKSSKGFTLIELLVVVAIIATLASIVIASLNTARARGADATIKAQLSGIRTQAGIVYENLSSYGTGFSGTGGTTQTCTGSVDNTLFGTTTVQGMIAGAVASAGAGNVSCATDTTSASVATKWVVAARLKTDTTQAWCVDYTGASKQETWTAVDADAINTVCP